MTRRAPPQAMGPKAREVLDAIKSIKGYRGLVKEALKQAKDTPPDSPDGGFADG
jgi:hypothetical protein